MINYGRFQYLEMKQLAVNQSKLHLYAQFSELFTTHLSQPISPLW